MHSLTHDVVIQWNLNKITYDIIVMHNTENPASAQQKWLLKLNENKHVFKIR